VSGLFADLQRNDDVGGGIFTPLSDDPHVTVLRTRLAVWAWGASNFGPQPGLGVTTYPISAKVQYAYASTGSFPPPTNWPDDPAGASEQEEPVLVDALTPTAGTFKPSTGEAGSNDLWSVTYSLTAPGGDSKGQRRFDGTNLISSWVGIGQSPDWVGTCGGCSGLEFQSCFLLQTLVEYPD
jgi:hypothetical protein